MTRIEMLDTLTTNFNLPELQDLCYSLEINYESLIGQAKSCKARELILFAERHKRIDDLVYAMNNFTPNAIKCEYCGMGKRKCGCGAN